jgi:hypothetical protein
LKIQKNINAILRNLGFKAKKAFNKYKDSNAWLDAVYRNNKTKIDAAYADIPSRLSKKTLFKNNVREYVKRGAARSIPEALARLERTTIFMTKAQIMYRNAIEGMRNKFPKQYKLFRELTKDWNRRYTTTDPNKLSWDKYSKVYIYDAPRRKIALNYRNSPERLDVYVVLEKKKQKEE